jgi:hypothetical protein
MGHEFYAFSRTPILGLVKSYQRNQKRSTIYKSKSIFVS